MCQARAERPTIDRVRLQEIRVKKELRSTGQYNYCSGEKMISSETQNCGTFFPEARYWIVLAPN
jgi:hypothetical protein